MTEVCRVKSFVLCLKYADVKLQKYFPRDYEYIKINGWLNIINKHNAYPVKWYKPTKEGLRVKCKTFDDETNYPDVLKDVQDYCTDVNKKFGTKFGIVKDKEY